MIRAGHDDGPCDDNSSTNRDGGSRPRGAVGPTHRSPPGRPSTARPSASEFVSATTVIGCHGGTSRVIAPGRVCHANTSASGWSTTLSYSMPIYVGYPTRYRRQKPPVVVR